MDFTYAGMVRALSTMSDKDLEEELRKPVSDYEWDSMVTSELERRQKEKREKLQQEEKKARKKS